MPSDKCKKRLSEPPPCGDTKLIRSYVFCKAFDRVTGGKADLSTAMTDAWAEVRKLCPKP